MADESSDVSERRALLTDREREIISGDADVANSYRYQTVSRVRRRFDRLTDDLQALEAHGDLADELRQIVCGDEEASQLRAQVDELADKLDEARQEDDRASDGGHSDPQNVDTDELRENVRHALDELEVALTRGDRGEVFEALRQARDSLRGDHEDRGP